MNSQNKVEDENCADRSTPFVTVEKELPVLKWNHKTLLQIRGCY